MSSLLVGPQPSPVVRTKEEICLLRRAGRKVTVCDLAYKNSIGLISPTWLHPFSCQPADGGCPLAFTGNKKWWR